jgi:hypothetical protein
VTGFLGETQEDPEGRLTERLDPFGIASCDDVSHDDILCIAQNRVNDMIMPARSKPVGQAIAPQGGPLVDHFWRIDPLPQAEV